MYPQLGHTNAPPREEDEDLVEEEEDDDEEEDLDAPFEMAPSEPRIQSLPPFLFLPPSTLCPLWPAPI